MSQQPPNPEQLLGESVGGVRLERKLGAGGMGAVFLGTHPELGQVGIKLLRAVPAPPPQFVSRFFREAQAMEQLTHDGIVRVFGHGQQDPFYYIIMEYVDGHPLEKLIRDKKATHDARMKAGLAPDKAHGRLKISRGLRTIRDVADAMAYAHERGILHRDLKPDNILVNEQTQVCKIIDFGLAKVDGGDNLTMTGQIMGTPMYMAPEQAEGKAADHRTDVYSLGAVGFFILTSEFPFLGKSGMDILLKKIRDNPRNMRELRPEIPGPVADLIERMMARDPDKRFSSMGRIRDILNQALKPRSSGSGGGASRSRPQAQARPASSPAQQPSPRPAPTGHPRPASQSGGSQSGVAPRPQIAGRRPPSAPTNPSAPPARPTPAPARPTVAPAGQRPARSASGSGAGHQPPPAPSRRGAQPAPGHARPSRSSSGSGAPPVAPSRTQPAGNPPRRAEGSPPAAPPDPSNQATHRHRRQPPPRPGGSSAAPGRSGRPAPPDPRDRRRNRP